MEEKITSIKFETTEAEKSVKQLRQEISGLRDVILNTEEGTEEYNSAVKQLITSQDELNKVSNKTIKGITAAAGSYEALVFEMAQLKKEWKATGDEAKRDEIGKQISGLNSKLKDMNVSVMDAGQLIGNATKAAAGMTGAFQVGAGVMNLFGVESEASVKAIQQMQNVMAMTQGFSAIDQGIKGFKRLGIAIKSSALFNKLFTKTIVQNTAATTANATAQVIGGKATDAGTKSVWKFNTALLANPITWIVAGVVAFVAAIGALIIATNKVEYAQADFNAELEKTKRLQEDLEISQSEELQLMAARGATEREMMDQRIKDANTNLKNANALVDKLTAVEGVRNAEQQEKYKEALDNQKKYAAEFRQVGIDSAALDLKTTTDANKKKADDDEAANKKAAKRRKEQREKEAAEQAEYARKVVEIETWVYEQKLSGREKEEYELQKAFDARVEQIGIEKAIELGLEEQLKIDLSNINKKYADEEQARIDAENQKIKEAEQEAKDFIADKKRSDKEREIQELQEAFDARVEQIGIEKAIELGLEEQFKTDLAAVNDKYREQEKEADKKAAEDKKKLQRENLDFGLAIAGALSSILNDIGEANTKDAKKKKKLQIASAYIDMLAGAIMAFTQAGNPYLGAVLAAGVVVAGLVNIKKMKETKIEGSSGGDSVATPSVNVANLMATQKPVQAVSATTGASAEQQIQDTRVYVVESDIAATTKKVAVAQAEATY